MVIKKNILNNFIYIILFLSFCWLFANCEKINIDPVFSTTPAIKLLEISHEEVIEFQDSLVIRIEYEDGDGNLGNPDTDVNSLFIKDSRLDTEDGYFVGPLAPVGADISIRGTLKIEVGTFFLLGNGSQEKTVLTIYMKDRDGNDSNVLETDPIIISRK